MTFSARKKNLNIPGPQAYRRRIDRETHRGSKLWYRSQWCQPYSFLHHCQAAIARGGRPGQHRRRSTLRNITYSPGHVLAHTARTDLCPGRMRGTSVHQGQSGPASGSYSALDAGVSFPRAPTHAPALDLRASTPSMCMQTTFTAPLAKRDCARTHTAGDAAADVVRTSAAADNG